MFALPLLAILAGAAAAVHCVILFVFCGKNSVNHLPHPGQHGTLVPGEKCLVLCQVGQSWGGSGQLLFPSQKGRCWGGGGGRVLMMHVISVLPFEPFSGCSSLVRGLAPFTIWHHLGPGSGRLCTCTQSNHLVLNICNLKNVDLCLSNVAVSPSFILW